MRLEKPFDGEEIRQLRLEITETCEAQGLPDVLTWDLIATADEVICNVLEHSHADWLEFEMALDFARSSAQLVMRDNGVHFDLNAAVIRAETAAGNGTHRKMGLLLVKKAVDSMDITRRPDGVNELTLNLSAMGSNQRQATG